jgi:signal transduction histidine kinase
MKRSISYKFIASYFLIVIISMGAVGFIFSNFGRSYMETKTIKYLKSDAYDIEKLFLEKLSNEDQTIEDRLKQLREEVRKGIGTISSECIIISADMKVIFPKETPEVNRMKMRLMPKIESRLQKNEDSDMNIKIKNAEYVLFIHPVVRKSGGKITDWLITYTPIASMRQLNDGMFMILLVSMALISIPAILFGIFMARSIAKPIVKLKKRAELLSNRDFDSRVEIHTGDELEELANTMNKMAEVLKQYDAGQRKFIQNASHELKTPLMSIQGYAEGIKDGVFDDNSYALDIIAEESTRLKRIVDEVIFLSKLETMEDFYKFGWECINKTIEKSVEKLRSIAIKNNIDINTDLCGNINLWIDEDKITEALINVIGNCLRHAAGNINITTVNEGEFFAIRIADDGEGFEETDLKNIFERFYKGSKGDTGLGMAITKVIIEKHGGNISAANAIGGGAEFIIRLPI